MRKALLRAASREALSLAAMLGGCGPLRPCLSGACPACGGAFQRLFERSTRSLFGGRGGNMLAVSVVWRGGSVAPGELIDDDLFEPTRRRLLRALDDVGVPALGGLDVSLNDHESGRFARHWAPHAQLFVPEAPMRRGEVRFADWFPSSRRIPHPLFIKVFDGRPQGREYAVKPDFSRRISLEPRTLEGGNRSTFSTRKKPIWGAERVELALALDRAGLEARLVLRGYELVASRGDVEIVRSSRARAT